MRTNEFTHTNHVRQIEFKFDSYTEFIDFANEHRYSYTHARDNSMSGWLYANSWEKALELAQNGWKDGLEQFNTIVEDMDITSKVCRPTIVFDVTGNGGFDMGRVLSGQPESVMDWTDSDIKFDSPNGPVIKIVVDCGLSSGVNASLFTMRGSAVLALVDALEEAGRRVELETVWTSGDLNGSEMWYLQVPLKSAESALQIDQIAYALSNQDFVRRFCFAAHSQMSPEAKASAKRYCGTPSSEPIKPDCDIYIERMTWGDYQWNDIESAKSWVQSKLKEFGVSIGI